MENSETTKVGIQDATDQTTINHETISKERLYLKRYEHCRRLIEKDSRFNGM